MKQSIQPEGSVPTGLFSEAILSNGFIFVSGQIHMTADGTLVEGSTEEKVRQIMSNIKVVLGVANASLNDVVKATIYITEMSILPELNKVYPTYFSELMPARETVCVKELPLGASIEISVIATKND